MPKRVTRSSAKTSLEAESSGGLVIKISKKKQEARKAFQQQQQQQLQQQQQQQQEEAAEAKGGKRKAAEGRARQKARPLTADETALQRRYRRLAAARAAAAQQRKGSGGGEEAAARPLAASVAGMATLLRSSAGAVEELDEAARSQLAAQLQAAREAEPEPAPAPAPLARRAEETDAAGAALGRAAQKAAAGRAMAAAARREAAAGEEEAMPAAGEQAMPYGHPAQAQAGYSTHTVFVGDISPNVMMHDLEDAFSRCGAVESVRVIPGKPFAFVQFVEAEFAQKALAEMNGASVCDCVIRVSPAKVQGSTGGGPAHWSPGPRFAGGGRNYWDPTGHAAPYAPPAAPPPAHVPPQLREHLEQQQLYGHLGPTDADLDRGLVSYEDI